MYEKTNFTCMTMDFTKSLIWKLGKLYKTSFNSFFRIFKCRKFGNLQDSP